MIAMMTKNYGHADDDDDDNDRTDRCVGQEEMLSLLSSSKQVSENSNTKTSSYSSSRSADDDDDCSSNNDNYYDYALLLFPLCVVYFMDAISFMVVAPSLVFLVRDTLHGSKEMYGIIMSIFSLASFLAKPILGYACDHYDQFRSPYLISTAIAALGGIFYFLASNVVVMVDQQQQQQQQLLQQHEDERIDQTNVNTNTVGLWLLFWGRCLGGIGSANSTLAFTYIAKVVREQDMTKANAFLSMMRVIGMTLAPASFAILAQVPNATLVPGRWLVVGGMNFTLHVDPLNSVGILLFACNAVAFLVIYIFLKEPPEEQTKAVQAEREAYYAKHPNESFRTNAVASMRQQQQQHHRYHFYWEFIKACMCFEILLFVFGIFCLNSNFQLLETALAPASNDALGWTPFQVSALFGANAVFLLIIIAGTFYLSTIGVSDFDLLIGGLVMSIFSYILLYLWWIRGAPLWKFIAPVMLSTGAFPFLGAPTRSLYTKVVAAKSRLRNHQGTMQAVLSMAASVSGFLAPGLIAAFVLRTPEQVTASRHGRELTGFALMAPFSSACVLIGAIYLRQHPVFQVYNGSIRSVVPDAATATADTTRDHLYPPTAATESTTLVETYTNDNADEFVPLPHLFEPSTEAHRRDSSIIMGIPQFDCFLESPEQSQRKSIFHNTNVSFRKTQHLEEI